MYIGIMCILNRKPLRKDPKDEHALFVVVVVVCLYFSWFAVQ